MESMPCRSTPTPISASLRYLSRVLEVNGEITSPLRGFALAEGQFQAFKSFEERGGRTNRVNFAGSEGDGKLQDEFG
jgi:hypothetical protein